MKLSEVLGVLQEHYDKYGDDLPIRVDHRSFPLVLNIESIEIGDTYTGPRKPVLYVYLEDTDVEILSAQLKDL